MRAFVCANRGFRDGCCLPLRAREAYAVDNPNEGGDAVQVGYSTTAPEELCSSKSRSNDDSDGLAIRRGRAKQFNRPNPQSTFTMPVSAISQALAILLFETSIRPNRVGAPDCRQRLPRLISSCRSQTFVRVCRRRVGVRGVQEGRVEDRWEGRFVCGRVVRPVLVR